uniref:PDZ domain-containing protein n=1 Tax=Trichobilharzia regenti TaxID=157069 RepID=A0AA85KC58_TRIRE|nr:unnamed protein product [Trichobilharzia regenti]
MKDCAETKNHQARLCHLKKWPNFSGYGFSLRTDSLKNEHRVENVELLSPSESGGLLAGDIILLVNNKSVGKSRFILTVIQVDRLSHIEVVKMIKEKQDVELLVAQPYDLAYFKKFKDPLTLASKDPKRCETSVEPLEILRNLQWGNTFVICLKASDITTTSRTLVVGVGFNPSIS